MISFRDWLHKHATLGQQWTFQLTWKRKQSALIVSPIANWPPIPPQSHLLNSGDQKKNIKMYLSPSRLCDSRNLNLSPFCNLTTSSLVKWEPSIRATYENISTSYTTGLPGPMRPKYPPFMVEKELISSLTKVNKFRQTNYSIGHTFNDQFTLSRWSIYSLKGKPGLQRLWKGHCCCQSVLWRLNCVWWFA